jgi:hypothetical protein
MLDAPFRDIGWLWLVTIAASFGQGGIVVKFSGERI